MFCCYFGGIGHEIIHHELPSYGQTFTSELYCQQLDSLKEAIVQKCPTTIVTLLGWEVFMQTPYLLDLATIDYLLFLPMANDLTGKDSTARDARENQISQFALIGTRVSIRES